MSPNRPQHDTDLDLDPVIAAELDALEAALAGRPDADPALLGLVAAVRDDTPAPRPDFRRELDARAADGFPRGGGGGPRALAAAVQGRLSAHRIGLVPALGAAATVIVALVVAASALHGSGSGSGSGSGAGRGGGNGSAVPSLSAPTRSGESAPATPAAGAATQSQDSAGPEAKSSIATVPPGVPVPAPTPSPVAPGVARKVEQSTQLALRTSAGRLQQVADGVVRVTQAAGGFVQQSNVDATDGGGTADFTLSVPSAQAKAAVAGLSRLAHVSSMSQSQTDITAGFVSVSDRLHDARAERRALLKALAAARTAEGIARLRSRIAAGLREIGAIKGELRGLRRRADNTTILVTVTALRAAPKPAGHGGTGGGGWTPGDAAHDALRVLEVAAGVLLVGLAVLLPAGLILVPALLGARYARRRRREGALDPA
ncbi:DUF4349 domain-containing protein [Paraconexibacter antarcticus]|uniref:DUF4349 domain-containing protein n=1 Tax=Paraconexibacter antarcticus TaxID=2949664 RepID=A0ABY5DQV6_9ACTN|nr:DUF4349 domain-containing protein [Paraconexibacter antarcticus]UTI64413.1 DUF4349 domain-containing protein [Paraconexibacter antarcticus]